jgi:hypothetical protein
MPGVTLDAQCGGGFGCALQPRKFSGRASRIARRDSIAPGARMQLDSGCAYRARSFDGSRFRLDEERDDDTGTAQFGGDAFQMVMAADDIETAFGRALLAPFRHEAGGVWTRRNRDFDHFIRRRHFKIQRLGNMCLQPRDILVANVPSILPQMRGDPVSASFDRQKRGAQRIGYIAAAGIPQCRNMIDIDAET